MGRIHWRPGDYGPARFGLTSKQWQRIAAMHETYEQRGPMDRASYTPSRRLEFAKYLVQHGIVNEGDTRRWKG